jgi:hypothetical protein
LFLDQVAEAIPGVGGGGAEFHVPRKHGRRIAIRPTGPVVEDATDNQ